MILPSALEEVLRAEPALDRLVRNEGEGKGARKPRSYWDPPVRDKPGEVERRLARRMVGWVWPMESEPRPPWRAPAISDRYRYREGAGRWHNGIDLGYRRSFELAHKDQNENQTARYDIWPGTRVLAAGPGRVVEARRSKVGGLVRLAHRGGLETVYLHLERFDVKRGDQVAAGDELGTAGVFAGVRHLHFELWHGYRRRVLDPGAYIWRWRLDAHALT